MRLASLKDPEEQPDKAAKPDPLTQATSLLHLRNCRNSGPGDGKEAEGEAGAAFLPASQGTQEMGPGTGRRQR